MIGKNKYRVSITLDKKHHRLLDKISKLSYSTKSEIVQELIDLHLKNYYKTRRKTRFNP